MKCPCCGSNLSVCAECGDIYENGERSKCKNSYCQQFEAVLECQDCQKIVSNNADGVLDERMTFHPYKVI